MKLRVVGDGTSQGTRVEDAETGELVENVAEIKILITGRRACKAEVLLVHAVSDLDITTDVELSLEAPRKLCLERKID